MISPTNLTHTTTHVNPHTQHNYTLTYKHEDVTYGVEFDNSKANLSNSTFELSSVANFTEYAEIPYYIKATSMSFCIAIMCLGVIGNVMVPIVILKTKDMRNSTNIFLVNLSIADLLVLLVCTPTVLVEVGSKPDTWLLGKELCVAVPFVELTVTHASVLTILAISFERYYAICEPLRAGYVCTKTRAALICALVWFFAALFTSPILAIAEHHEVTREDGSVSAQCLTQVVTFWPIVFFLMIIVLLYLLPLIILIVLYSIIAKNLITAASKVVMNKTFDPYNARARKQVILMLGTVVLCFFLCLMPYRVLTLWIIVTPAELYDDLTPEKWYNILYFSRVMLYLNSAINPILYNLMSSKFRLGFCKICICYNNSEETNRRATRMITNGSTTSSSLTRTTNSLKKLFGHRGSVDKSDGVDSDTKDEGETRSLFGRIFTNKNFVRQQSAPVWSAARPAVISRMRSEGSMPAIVVASIEDKIGHSTKSKVEEMGRAPGSLRRSVLIHSAKAHSVDGDRKVSARQVKVDCVVAFQKCKSVDYELPESFV